MIACSFYSFMLRRDGLAGQFFELFFLALRPDFDYDYKDVQLVFESNRLRDRDQEAQRYQGSPSPSLFWASTSRIDFSTTVSSLFWLTQAGSPRTWRSNMQSEVIERMMYLAVPERFKLVLYNEDIHTRRISAQAQASVRRNFFQSTASIQKMDLLRQEQRRNHSFPEYQRTIWVIPVVCSGLFLEFKQCSAIN